MGVISGSVTGRKGPVMNITEAEHVKSVGLQPCTEALKREQV
jgi:hypothetical protein